MSKPDVKLLAIARSHVLADPEAEACWELLLEGIELGWVGESELSKLISFLSENGSWGSEELIFEIRGDSVCVMFVRETQFCNKDSFVAELRKLAQQYAQA